MENIYSRSTYRLLTLVIATLLLTGPLSSLLAVRAEKGLSNGNETPQSLTVTGKIVSATDNSPLPGVSIIVKGTTRGTLSGPEGAYSIEVPGIDATLVFSFIGFEAIEEPVRGRKVVDISLAENVKALDEVVVTALGITRKEKSLGYSVGKVEGESLVRVTQENAINGLAGKVSGVQINSTGGTGSSVSMIIRGATSLSNDNQPLFVIDGVPIVNTLNNISGFGTDNRVDYGNAISDMNSDDIESVSILKGPSAAALYGSRAGNGVVLITTKTGKKNKGIQVDITTNTVFDKPYKYFAIEKKFANGYFSYTPEDLPAGAVMRVNPAEAAGCGIQLDKEYYAVQWNSPVDANGVQIPTELVSHPNNVANFVNTGITTTNGVSISDNNDVMNYRLGFTNMSNKGIVPNSDLFRNNLNASATVKVKNNLSVSSNINISRSWSNNRPASNRGTNPLQWAYAVPQNTDIRELRNYWLPGFEGLVQRTPDNEVYDNPYYLAYEVNNSYDRDRVFGNVKADWQLTKEFSLMARYSLDQFTEKRESKISPGYSKEPNNGAYGVEDIKSYERNIDFLATYAKKLGNFNISVSGGGNALYKHGSVLSTSSMPGAGLIVPDVYTIDNIKSGSLSYTSGWSQKAIYSIYGLATIGWRDMIFLDVTARNDWSSTLPKANRSYFYPSTSLSMLIDKMINMGDRVDMVKLRGGWARAGNDTDPYQLYSTYGNAGQWGDATRLGVSGEILTPNLKPEQSTSTEFGIETAFLKNRLRFEGTYYMISNKNQILRNVPVASSTGYDAVNINAGLIEGKGWEFTLGGTPIRRGSWTWDVSANFTRNRTVLKELAPGIDVYKFWEDARGGSWAYVGDELGSIYDASIRTVTDKSSQYYGYPILSTSELEWQDIPIQDTKNKIGNYNPNFIMGLQNAVTFKGFTLNFTIDWRNGGQFISQTQRYMAEDGFSEVWLNSMINPGGRSGPELEAWLIANEDKYIKNGFHVVGGPTAQYGGFRENYSGNFVSDGTFVPGVVEVQDADGNVTYLPNLGNNNVLPYNPYVASYAWGFAKPSMFDSDFIKLREISLSYQFPHRMGVLHNMTISVYSRNIMLWTKNKAGLDPERAFQAENSTEGKRGTQFKQGIERYNLEPWVMPIGFKIDLTF
jgi:TonB-linked SusC/RagA family outer membrane protein